MAYINLLPWREEAQRQRQQEYFTVLAFVGVVGLLIVFAVSQFYQAQIDGQQFRNQFLKNEIQILDIRIGEIRKLREKKEALQKRMAVVEQLQRSRNVGTQVMDEIANVVPIGVFLTRLEKQSNSLLVLGKSESNNHLSTLIRSIETSELLTEPTLESIISADEQQQLLSDFKMRLKIKGIQSATEATDNAAGGQ